MNYTTPNIIQSKNILNILDENYPLYSSNAKIYLNTIANNNKVFLVKNKKEKYILRESNRSKSREHLNLEVKFLTYLHEKKFQLTPYIIPNSNDNLITVHHKKYYILENFLPGTVKKSVNNLTDFNEKKLTNLFSALAKFSKAAQNFTNPIAKNNQTVSYYAKNGSKLLSALIKKIKNKAINNLLKKNDAFIINFAKETTRQLRAIKYDSLQKQIVHFDLHPGNVNYVGDKLSGIFDFDWVRFDNRLADLACTLGQSCYHYHGKNRAMYDKTKIALGLKAYRKAYGKSEYNLHKENQIIKTALRGYMFFQLLWIIEWHTKNPGNKKGYEYIKFSLDVLKLNDFKGLLN
ncbi:MAG: phosphotransferase [Candidatus Gracilibacteria bacterium]|jgi:Ser/Thr protein kinase RdoA (MazF antagonist)